MQRSGASFLGSQVQLLACGNGPFGPLDLSVCSRILPLFLYAASLSSG